MAEIVHDLQDKLLPVRAHALMELGQLVAAKDPSVERNLAYIIGLFVTNLADPDSFLYLTAINGLQTLATVHPARILPYLADEYRDAGKPMETRLKIGEALMKAVRRFGEVAPKYARVFLPPFLQMTRDPDPTMRASALANLGRICELLRFSLQSHIHEIVRCCTNVAKSDPEAMVGPLRPQPAPPRLCASANRHRPRRTRRGWIHPFTPTPRTPAPAPRVGAARRHPRPDAGAQGAGQGRAGSPRGGAAGPL